MFMKTMKIELTPLSCRGVCALRTPTVQWSVTRMASPAAAFLRLQECDEVLQRAAELTNPRSLPLFQENEELAMRLRVKTLNLLAVLEQRCGLH